MPEKNWFAAMPFALLVYVSLIAGLVLAGSSKSLQARQILLLDEFEPHATTLGVFNSFKHHLILIALTQKNLPPFDCHPNRYIIYDYQKETYSEITSGSLKINSDYNRLIKTKIHSIVHLQPGATSELKETVNRMISAMNISAQTMESGKTVSSDKTVSCWQQPVVLDLPTKIERPFPFLAANLCKNSWCSEFYWTDKQTIQFWVQIEPEKLHLIRLDTNSGKVDYLKSSPKYFRKTFSQLNAPRENLVNDNNRFAGSFNLSSQAGKEVRLTWKMQPDNRIRVELMRTSENKQAGDQVRETIHKMIQDKRFAEALRLLNFGFWLVPNDRDLKIEKLRIFASLLLGDTLIKSLRDDFSLNERHLACKELYADEALKNLSKQTYFTDRLKAICP